MEISVPVIFNIPAILLPLIILRTTIRGLFASSLQGAVTISFDANILISTFLDETMQTYCWRMYFKSLLSFS